MEVGKDVLYGYTGGMALYIPDWHIFNEFYKETRLMNLTINYKLNYRFIIDLLN